jgi:hypothetical protein
VLARNAGHNVCSAAAGARLLAATRTNAPETFVGHNLFDKWDIALSCANRIRCCAILHLYVASIKAGVWPTSTPGMRVFVRFAASQTTRRHG